MQNRTEEGKVIPGITNQTNSVKCPSSYQICMEMHTVYLELY